MDIEKLVRKAQKGNDKAYLQLFQHFEETIYRTAYVHVGNKEDALDVVQETAYLSFKSIQSLREPQYFKTWLIKIAMNCSMNVLRQRNKIIPFESEDAEQLSGVRDDDGGEEIALSLTLNDLIEKLDTNEKSVIMLKYYQDYTIQSIAELLNLPLGSTKTILYRGLNKLRQRLTRGEIS
ncbi:RNA polymerase subunit sigma-24 [Paenibacillus elgii]|uniref:RNA polymerase subunit sigma-24 n=1 Tax=Paenibacillus elgii TaxID=189691 RepID=A0A161S8Q9_9BACL|nr:sigma-70 family RNA polymerase sigma factor [Paenibacillus elgii]KZE81754.1 RNA polymerase subunit sigma-24 [Paenibacillus elgii]